MKIASLLVAGTLSLLALGAARAETAPDAALTAKATTLLHQLQAKISRIQTVSTVDFTDFAHARIYGNSLRDGWDTSYRYGDVRFRSRFGIGYDITPQTDSIAVLRPDSAYIGLTIASRQTPVAEDNSFDLGPYMPGCRIYVYYRQNFFGQEYLNDNLPTPVERKIYAIITAELTKLNGKTRVASAQ